MQTLTASQSAAYRSIIERGEAALARWSATNPMRASIERQVADARRVLGLSA